MSASTTTKEIVSIVKSMFYGEIQEEEVFPFPSLNASQVEMAKAMIDAVEKFAHDNVDSVKLDRDAKIPEDMLQGLAALGLCGLGVDEEYGGLGLDTTLYARIFSQIAGIDGAIATTLGAHQSIGFKALVNEGTLEQKKQWLPRLASGEVFAAFCLTEPGSGSDAYSIKTKAVKNGDGTYTITGQKLWITNAGLAGFYSVFAKTEHEDSSGKKVEKISCFIVEKEREGVSFGEKEDKMGIRASETRAVFFDNVKVPASNMIGDPGKGFKIAMNVLNTGRLSLGSGSVGGMKTILKLATAQAKTRKQFGDFIANFGLIQEKLSTMAANIYACESMVYMTTGKITQGMSEFSHESAICKVYCSEKLWDTIDKATQIAAGNAYMREYPYERLMRDCRINLIFEGTNEILRIFTALSGIKGPSDNLKELGKIADVSKVLQDPIKSVGLLTDFARKRISKFVGSKSLTKVHPTLAPHGQKFVRELKDFGIAVENTIMKYGKNIIGNELVQLRLANMSIELYAQICVLSRTTSILERADVSQSDKDYVGLMTELICRESRSNFNKNYKRLTSSYDKLIPKISKNVTERDGFGFDIIDF
ncbi:MAG TPA: acyl-CoA dehydrogenase family protein [Bacteriovoracaceae bacterium]|nr:acyl-CoA dehydrogenase family protein [Bacteriovoracaceae bacterium]